MQNTCESGRNESLARRLLDHMSDAHHFVIPYPENLVDPAGLLIELGRIVGEERACLACGRQFYGRRFHSSSSQKPNSHVALTAVRQHMLDKPGHMRLWCGEDDPLQVALTIAKAEEAGETSPPPAALAGGELFSRFYDQSVVAPSFVLPDTEEGVYEVRLPSGTVLGHRNLASVYRQHLPPTPTDVTLINQHALPSSRVTHTSRALVPSHIGPLCVRPQLHLPTKARADERHFEASRRAWELSTGIQGNLVLRAHLRRQY
ncbi:pre-60S factor rei1 [Clonorchis sinensis]|nr:pre-60S factor rei1 [Clonorchis sinensis]